MTSEWRRGAERSNRQTEVYSLLDTAMSEVRRRAPDYMERFPTARPSLAHAAALHDQCRGLSQGELYDALLSGFDYISRSWPLADVQADISDPVTMTLCRSIIDAGRAADGELPLLPSQSPTESVTAVLRGDYDERATETGKRYFVRRRGTRWLLLLNATGTPIESWVKFLADTEHDYKIILADSPSGGTFGGGLQWYEGVQTDAATLATILRAENVSAADVVAWCNGARIAIELAHEYPDYVRSLVVSTPMLRGIDGVAPNPSPFERELKPLLDGVSRSEDLAPVFAKAIAQQSLSPDWTRLTNDSSARAQALFAMPAACFAAGLIEPLVHASSLSILARRVASDEALPTHVALSALSVPMMTILGDSDRIVNNALTRNALARWCRNVSCATVYGAGHYVHDLQYQYFRLALDSFYRGYAGPAPSARQPVVQLGREVTMQPREELGAIP